MTKIVSKKLPHAVGYADVGDSILRQKIMLICENIKSLHAQLVEMQKALIEVQSMTKLQINSIRKV